MSQADILNQAIAMAMSCGWKNPNNYAAIDIDGTAMLRVDYLPAHIMSTPNEVLFDHEFAEALWGDGEVPDSDLLNVIRVWAEQVAVKHQGKIFSVDPAKERGYIAQLHPMSSVDAFEVPAQIVEGHKVAYKLQDVVATIPFATHRIKTVEVDMPQRPKYAWQEHLQRMVIAPDPIEYLGQHLPEDES